IPRHRRHAVRHRGDRGDRACAREAGLPAARDVHRRALGDDDMTAASLLASERALRILRGGLSLVAVAAIYEAVARSGIFPSVLLPTLPVVAHTLAGAIADGTMLLHAFYTLERVLIGCAMAIAIGLPLGILMGRYRAVESFVLPLA